MSVSLSWRGDLQKFSLNFLICATLSHTLTSNHSNPLYRPFSTIPHTHTHKNNLLPYTHSSTPTLTLIVTPNLSHLRKHTHTLSLTPPASYTDTLPLTHTYSRTHSHNCFSSYHPPLLSLSLSLSLTLSHYHNFFSY